MKIHASGEDYLEAILVLQKKMGMVRSIDLARHMGFSKPSISHAVGVLKNQHSLQIILPGRMNLHIVPLFCLLLNPPALSLFPNPDKVLISSPLFQ